MQRITLNQNVASTLRELERLGAATGRLQADLSSGIRIRRPSDDPGGQAVVLAERTEIQRQATRQTAVDAARARLQDANSRLLDAQRLLVRTRTIALQGRQSVDAGEREILAQEVDRLRDSLLNIANARQAGQALFAGADLNATPFRRSAAGADVVYSGSRVPGVTTFGDRSALAIAYTGDSVFNAGDRGEVLVSSLTGLAAGTGTASATGVREARIRHVSTAYAAGSGVTPGASSLTGDTVVGPSGAHTLTLTDTSGVGAFGVVSLNGGPSVTFQSSDVDLAVVGPHGEQVSLNLSAVTPGFEGAVAITAAGAISLDGGATEVPIDFSANQLVTDSRDGSSAWFDTQLVRSTGTAVVEFTETADAFAVLAQLSEELRNTDARPADQVHAAIGRRLDDLDRLSDRLLAVIGDQGVSLEQLDRLQAQSEERELFAQQRLNETEGTDYAAAALELQQQQTAMQFTLATMARLFDVSVLNYL